MLKDFGFWILLDQIDQVRNTAKRMGFVVNIRRETLI